MHQAMFMMNNAQLQKQIDASPDSGTVLARLLEEEKDDAKVIEVLYQRVLARSPTTSECDLLLRYMLSAANRGKAFEDILWSLLNTAEFTTRK
jgi:hypothetical protein